jgi:hypothetical protein
MCWDIRPCSQLKFIAAHVLCDCEALVHLRFRHLGQFSMEPGYFYDVPIGKVLHLIRSVGLTKGKLEGKQNRSEMVAVLGPYEALHTYIYTVEIHWRFGGTCRLHLQGCGISRARKQRESRWQAEPYITEDRPLHNHPCENLRSYKLIEMYGAKYEILEIISGSIIWDGRGEWHNCVSAVYWCLPSHTGRVGSRLRTVFSSSPGWFYKTA